PASVLVTALGADTGSAAAAGQQPLRVISRRRVVTVPLNPNLPAVRRGESVSIVLSSGARMPGRVIATGTRAVVAPRRPRRTGTGSGVFVQVSLLVHAVHDVLAVPVTALLALAGGGYG